MGEIITSRENAQKVLEFGTVKGSKTLISAIILVKNDETVSFDGDVLIKQKMLLKESVATKWQHFQKNSLLVVSEVYQFYKKPYHFLVAAGEW